MLTGYAASFTDYMYYMYYMCYVMVKRDEWGLGSFSVWNILACICIPGSCARGRNATYH